MGMVALRQWIASAFFVIHGKHGEVTRHAQEREVSRQRIYREEAELRKALADAQHESATQEEQLRQAQQQIAELKTRLNQAVVLDEALQTVFACVAQARGVTLRDCRELLRVLLHGKESQPLSRAELGRRTQAAGKRAGKLLEVLDELARQRVREVAADEIYVKDPVLMVVEPESLYWLSGRLAEAVTGAAWEQEFKLLPKLEQVIRDGGKSLKNGVARVNAERRKQEKDTVFDTGDHFHGLWGGSRGVNKTQLATRKLFDEAEEAQKELDECNRQGRSPTAAAATARHAWARAEKAMNTWQEREQYWQKTKQALQLFTASGELNTRPQAEAMLAEALAHLPDNDFAKTKRQLEKPELLSYLDRVQAKLAALPFAKDVTQAAVRQEGLRRRSEALQGDKPQAAALRGVLLMCAVVLAQVGEEGERAVAAVKDILRRAYRASSLVECINSVLRMHQAGHRRMTQGLLDLKRLYWNCHTFETGRRRKTAPYERLGIPWPRGLPWWELLNLAPEQLREKLSAPGTPP